MKPLKQSLALLVASFFAFSIQAQEVDKEKAIVNKWKIIKAEDNGKEIAPEHEKMILEIKKGNEFTVSSAFEETHRGTWKIAGDNVELTDVETKEVKKVAIKQLDEDHFTIQGYDKSTQILHFIPVSGKKSVTLNHKEFLVSKKWTVYKSDKTENVGMRLEFKPDMTFVMVPYGYKVPVASGKWKLSDDNTKLLMDRREDNGHMELDIVELHKHELVLKFDESGITNYMHDPKLSSKDDKIIAEAHKNDKK